MSIFSEFPYTNLQDMNLDWLVRTVKALEEAWNGFQVDWTQDVAEQVDAWLTAHPEATTTVLDNSLTTPKYQDGSITGAKIADNTIDNNKLTGFVAYDLNGTEVVARPLKKSSFTRESVGKTLIGHYASSPYKYLQSACVDPATGYLYLGFCDAAYNNCIIVQVDTSDFYTIISTSAALSLGHINDMTVYNGDIYVATGDTGSYANNIVIVNASSLTITSSKNMGAAVWEISHDPLNHVFYVGTAKLNVYDETLTTLITEITWEGLTSHAMESVTAQGSFVLDGTFVLLWSTNTGYYLTTFDLETGDLVQIQKYQATTNNEEAEAGVLLGDKLYIMSGQRYVEFMRHDIDFDSSNPEISDVMFAAKLIADGSDMDLCAQPGKYYSPSATNTATMANVPFTGRGFTMYVLSQSQNWLVQMIIPNSSYGMMYIRSYESGVGWHNWKALHGEHQTVTSGSISLNGTAQIPSTMIALYEAITISCYDGNKGGAMTIPTRAITAGHYAGGCCISAPGGGYWEITISTTGLITLTDEDIITHCEIEVLGM